MSFYESFVNGMAFALGTVIVSTVFGYLIFKYSKNWISRTIAEIWEKVKKEGVEGIDFSSKLKTKNKRKK